jgi:acyl-coenzyme A thioesterase PaaI-like protein
LQETHAPHNKCFGCGAANKEGLGLRSFVSGEHVIADWQPEARYEAFPGVLNGGIIGTLLDCNSNWAAAWFLMRETEAGEPPCTVTAEYTVKLLRPTPTDMPIRLRSRLTGIEEGRRAVIETDLEAGGKVCATFRGLFVAVSPGHPGYWKES